MKNICLWIKEDKDVWDKIRLGWRCRTADCQDDQN